MIWLTVSEYWRPCITLKINNFRRYFQKVFLFLTSVENPNFTKDSRQDILALVTELLHQAVDGTPGGDHQVRYGEVHQVVVHGGSENVLRYERERD